MPSNNKADALVIAAFIAIVVLLGLNFVAVKFSNQELAPFWGASLRFIIASAILFAIAQLKNITWPRGKALWAAAFYGLLLFGATYGLIYWSLLTVSSGTSSVIFTTIPLITLLVASLLGLEKMTFKGVAGAVIVIVGIGFTFSEQLNFNVPLFALLVVLLAAITATLSGIVVKYFPQNHPITMNGVGMGIGAVSLLLISLLLGERLVIPFQTVTLFALAYLVTSSIAAFILYVWLVGKWPVSKVAYTAVLPPLVTIPIASLLLGETVGISFLIGTLLVLGGVYVGALSPKKA